MYAQSNEQFVLCHQISRWQQQLMGSSLLSTLVRGFAPTLTTPLRIGNFLGALLVHAYARDTYSITAFSFLSAIAS